MNVESALWSRDHLDAALEAVARRHGLVQESWPSLTLKSDDHGRVDERSIADLGLSAGLLIEPTHGSDSEIEKLVCDGAPAVIQVPAHGRVALLVLASRARRGTVRVLEPTGVERAVPVERVVALLRAEFDRVRRPAADALLHRLGLSPHRRVRALEVLLSDRPARATGWLLRPALGLTPARVLRRVGVLTLLAAFLAAHLASTALTALGWWALGTVALTGMADTAWLLAWSLALIGRLPLSMLASWAQARLSLLVGTWLRQRLMLGVLRTVPETGEGSGRMLGRVIESEALQSQALGGVFATITGSLEWAMAAAVLSASAGGSVSATAFFAWTGVLCVQLYRRHRAQSSWTHQRMQLTHDLVEQVVGHRTRKVQEPGTARHRGDDERLDEYLSSSTRFDNDTTLMDALVSRGWMLVGLAAMLPTLVWGAHNPASLAAGIGGIILGGRALAKLSGGTVALSAAVIAGRQVAALSRGARRSPTPPALPGITGLPRPSEGPAVEVSGLSYSYPSRGRPVLDRCSVRIDTGDRVLLLGTSGSGKSTLAKLLTGLEEPASGTISLNGLDRTSWGQMAWRQRVASIPQFHDNHVLSGTLAFNLLLGRQWPASPHDLTLAEHVCRGLGLGPLLDRMPAGIQQPVGFAGWQLSHGEKSRVFIARAILQDPDVAIFDESFGALDAENLSHAMQFALSQLRTSVVIAHP